MIPALIAFDPSTITVTRHTKVANAGGYSWTETDLDPVDVRLYNISTRNQREFTIEPGEVKQISLGILAESTADFVFGHDSYDTFTHEGRTYRIVGVRLYDDTNVPEMIQADCVAV